MAEESAAWKSWREGLDLWKDERLDDAAESFREAIAQARPGEPALVEYHQSLGHVLDDLGSATQAQTALEEALRLALERHNDNASTEVVVARCFLAEHFVRVLRFHQAIDVTEPSVSVGARLAALLFSVRARAFRELGQRDRAREDAQRAIELATSPGQKEKIARELDGLLPPPPEPEEQA